jgi:hypothetical protein
MLKNSPNLLLDPDEYKEKYELNKKSIVAYLVTLKDRVFHNADIPTDIRLSTRAIKKHTTVGMSNEEYMKSLAYIPAFAEKAVLIKAENQTKDRYDTYYHLVAGAIIGNTPYTAHIIIGERNGGWYYYQRLSPIEKGSLIDTIQQSKPGYQTSLSEVQDTILLKLLQVPYVEKQQNSAENVENPSYFFPQ